MASKINNSAINGRFCSRNKDSAWLSLASGSACWGTPKPEQAVNTVANIDSVKSLLIDIIIYSFVRKFEVIDENIALLSYFSGLTLMIFEKTEVFVVL
jgi:hypothetical protein